MPKGVQFVYIGVYVGVISGLSWGYIGITENEMATALLLYSHQQGLRICRPEKTKAIQPQPAKRRTGSLLNP